MIRARRPGIALVALAASVASGCGLGPGDPSAGEATLTVTRDYGTELLAEAAVSDPPSSETVLRLLDREAEITTRYGGGFVQSINGVSGEIAEGRSSDWFFYVNGSEASRGGADVAVQGGDRIWWDYRDWTDAMRVPAVVGSWPEPFVQASAGAERLPVRVECAGSREPCRVAIERLAEEGVDASIEALTGTQLAARGEALRLLVGVWPDIRRDPLASRLERGPSASGVFARFEPRGQGGFELLALDQSGEPESRLGPGSGLIAAVREADDPPVWIATGLDSEGVETAVEALRAEQLERRYALATRAETQIALPALESEIP